MVIKYYKTLWFNGFPAYVKSVNSVILDRYNMPVYLPTSTLRSQYSEINEIEWILVESDEDTSHGNFYP